MAVTRIVGGARKGYCSKLSPRRLLSPSSTVMIAMTIATIGRLMKKSAMSSYPFAPLASAAPPAGAP